MEDGVDLTLALPPELNAHILSFVVKQNNGSPFGMETWQGILRFVCQLWSRILNPEKTSLPTIVLHWPRLCQYSPAITGELLATAAIFGRIDVLVAARLKGHLSHREPDDFEAVHSPKSVEFRNLSEENGTKIPWTPLLLYFACRGNDSPESIATLDWLLECGQAKDDERCRELIVDCAIGHLSHNILERFLRPTDTFDETRVGKLMTRICNHIVDPNKRLNPWCRYEMLPDLLIHHFGHTQLHHLHGGAGVMMIRVMFRLARERPKLLVDRLDPSSGWYEVFERFGWCLQHHISLLTDLEPWLDPESWSLTTYDSRLQYGNFGEDGIRFRVGLHLLLSPACVPQSRHWLALERLCEDIVQFPELVVVLLWFAMRLVVHPQVLQLLMARLSRYQGLELEWEDLYEIDLDSYLDSEGRPEWDRLICTTKALLPPDQKIPVANVRAIGTWLLERAIETDADYLPKTAAEVTFYHRTVAGFIRYGTVETFRYFFDTYPRFMRPTFDALDIIVDHVSEGMMDAIFERFRMRENVEFHERIFWMIQRVLQRKDNHDSEACQRFIRSSCRNGFPWKEGYLSRLRKAFSRTPLPERCLTIIERFVNDGSVGDDEARLPKRIKF